MTPPLSSLAPTATTAEVASSPPPHLSARPIARLVAPLSPEEFFADAWEQRPVHLRRSDTFADLFTLADLDHVANYAEADVGAVRAVRGIPQVFNVDRTRNTPNVHTLYRAWHEGYTIGAKFLHRYWPPLVRFCQHLEDALHHQAGVNLYFSPPHAQGFGHHRDAHDVFIVQSHGHKRWQIYAPPQPLSTTSAYCPEPQTLGPPVLDCELRQGEGLYIPRGFPHVAVSTDSASLHLTVAVQPTTHADLLRAVIERLGDRDVRFREALPPGWQDPSTLGPRLRPLLAALHNAIGDSDEDGPLLDATRNAQRRERWAALQPAADGQFAQLAQAHTVEADTILERRQGMRCEITVELTTATVHFPGRALPLPVGYASALRHVAEQKRFSANTLPGIADAEQRLELARTLVREGLATISAG